MFLPDVFSYVAYFVPVAHQFIIDHVSMAVENGDVSPDFFELLEGRLGVFAALITVSVVIITAVVGVGVWLRKTVTAENRVIRTETKAEIEKTKVETKNQIEDNQILIKSTKQELGHKIDLVTATITDKLSVHKEVFGDIKHTMEKISDRLDENVQGYNRNVTRLNNHERKLDTIESKVYGVSGYDETLRRMKRKNTIDARYSLPATEEEETDEYTQEGIDERSKNREVKRRKDDDDITHHISKDNSS